MFLLLGIKVILLEKNKKFDSSKSQSIIKFSFNDFNVNNTKKYGIIVIVIIVGEKFNDSYINKDKTPIPIDYIINPIDERSNIYNR